MNGSAGKESTCNAGDVGSVPESEISSGARNGNPFHCSCLKNPMDKSLVSYSPTGLEESNMTDQLSIQHAQLGVLLENWCLFPGMGACFPTWYTWTYTELRPHVDGLLGFQGCLIPISLSIPVPWPSPLRRHRAADAETRAWPHGEKHMHERHCLVCLLWPRVQKTKPNPTAMVAQRKTMNHWSCKEQGSVMKENPDFSLNGQILESSLSSKCKGLWLCM